MGKQIFARMVCDHCGEGFEILNANDPKSYPPGLYLNDLDLIGIERTDKVKNVYLCSIDCASLYLQTKLHSLN